ncbi:MAG: hypothetical protein KBF12_08845 [Sebaldella sp.]|nr:hypothetical protein [Sebaldella sp.]
MNQWIKDNIVSFFSILISSGTAIWLGIITYKQNIKIANQKEKHEFEMAVQKKDLDTEISRLTGNIERLNFIHKTQFDTEFKLYKKIWSKITIIIDIFSDINDQLNDIIKLKIDSMEMIDLEKKLKTSIENLIFNTMQFSETVSKNRPFYFQELYLLLSIFGVQTNLLRKYVNNDDFSKINVEKYNFELEKLIKFSLDIEEIIRNRIENLKIIE